MARDGVVSLLANGLADLAVGYYPDTAGALESEILYHEHHVCLFDPRACGIDAPIALADYLALPHFLVSSRADFSGVIDAELAAHGHARFIQLSTTSFLAVPFLLRGTRAVAIVPARLAKHCRDEIGLAVSPPPVTVRGFDVATVWHRRTDTDPAQRWFRERIREAVLGSAERATGGAVA